MNAFHAGSSTRIGLMVAAAIMFGFALFSALQRESPPTQKPAAEAAFPSQWDGKLRDNGPRFSNRAIRALNDGIPLPEDPDLARKEHRKLAVQQRRFEQRYGKDSVAARSLRMRLRDLHDHAIQDAQYTAADKPENAEPE